MANPFEDCGLASGYEAWYAGRGQRDDRMEKQLLAALLADLPRGRTLLEVGCGTGHFTRWFAKQGIQSVGLDVSMVMLAEASKRNGLHFVMGDALALPFADQSFDLVALVTTLEFVSGPQRVLEEAIRVARRGLLLGVLNRLSLRAFRRRLLSKPPWNSARFFSVRELKRLVRESAGERLACVRWRTTLWPLPGVRSLPLPWGGFIGMAAGLHTN